MAGAYTARRSDLYRLSAMVPEALVGVVVVQVRRCRYYALGVSFCQAEEPVHRRALPQKATGSRMTDSASGFYSTQDADPTPLRSGDDRSEGAEGKFIVWTRDEIRAVLGSDVGLSPGRREPDFKSSSHRTP